MKKGDKLFYGWIIVLGGVLIGAATNLLNSIANVVIGLVSEDFSVPRTMFNLATVISMPVVMVLSPVAGVPLASMVTTPIISWLVDTVGWRQAYLTAAISLR